MIKFSANDAQTTAVKAIPQKSHDRDLQTNACSDQKERAGRNRTICLSESEANGYLSRCPRENAIEQNCGLTNTIILGDCFNVLPKFSAKFVDLLIVDPPYNLDKTYGASKFKKMGSAEYEVFTRNWIELVLHTLKPSCSIYVCCDWQTSVVIGSILSDYFIIQNRITWQREKGRGALSNWKNSMEDIWFATMSKNFQFNVDAVKQRRRVIAPYRADGKPKDWTMTEDGNYRDTCPSNFWDDISVPYWSMPENTDHPTQKPEKLFAKLILASSNQGDTILDPFVGVGTSCVAAKKLGRNYVGIEKEPEYCALAAKRLEMAASDSSIQGYADNVFWERNSLADQKKCAARENKIRTKNASLRLRLSEAH
ncbi:MAG: site-specific DNA-methyltransferase [Holophagales bacterium]|jgi:site-specific DNA-methyltransferase (adenine-specific)|nr:site-specific DNA-methyltransferase [Holophagales bacterium]